MVNIQFKNKKSRSKRNLKDKSNKSKRKTSINRKRNRQSKIRSKKNKKGGMQEGEQITIQLRTTLDDNQEIFLEVNENEEIYKSICKGLLTHNIDCEKMSNFIIYLGEEPLENDDTTFDDLEIEDGARLDIQIATRASFYQVVDDIVRLNPETIDKDRVDELKEKTIIDSEKPWCVKDGLVLDYMGITQLPESLGDLVIEEDLYLSNNNLTSLPNSFANLNIDGNLWLERNQLTTLPDNFHEIKVGMGIFLDNNRLTSLPTDFGKLSTGLKNDMNRFGGLNLSGNQLTILPESMKDITVKGNLFLRRNQLVKIYTKEDFPKVTGRVISD